MHAEQPHGSELIPTNYSMSHLGNLSILARVARAHAVRVTILKVHRLYMHSQPG